MRRDYMTVSNISKKKGKSLYRDLKGLGKNQPGIFYYEYNGMLYRQVLEQDIELVREARKIVASKNVVKVKEKSTGKIKWMTLEQVMMPEDDKAILEIIKELDPESGINSLAVFDVVTKEFVAILDIETLPDSEWKKGGVTFTFDKTKETLYGEKVKKDFNNICKESGFFIDGIEEVTWNGEKPTFIPI